VPRRLRSWPGAILPPFIAPFVPKNRELDSATIDAALAHCGLAPAGNGRVPAGNGRAPAGNGRTAGRAGGTAATRRFRHPATVVSEAVLQPGQPLLVQVSRWDRLKDMDGVLRSITSFVEDGYLALVGPYPTGIPDDIEQTFWYDRCLTAWRSLPRALRGRAALVCLPMTDLGENATLVNAVQRAADVVLQKSLAEGFGLTVAEAMWKSRVVVASAVGGIRTQIDHGDTGFLVDDPTDLECFGHLAAMAVGETVDRHEMGTRAHDRVLREFLPDREVVATARLLSDDRKVLEQWHS
jgi:trehalose synthase